MNAANPTNSKGPLKSLGFSLGTQNQPIGAITRRPGYIISLKLRTLWCGPSDCRTDLDSTHCLTPSSWRPSSLQAMSTGSAPPPISLSDIKSILLAVNAASLVETLFYGIHFVLFCICVFILIRDRRPTHWIILVSAFIMFALSTADISITIRLMTHDIATTLDYLLKRLYPKNPIFVTNNFIAELILLYRCYMIWGRSKYLLVAAGFLVLGDTIWGFLSMTQSFLLPPSKFIPVYLWSVFAINIVISMVAAGRIFWVSKIARPILGHRSLRHYHFVIAILLESSAVYSACLLSYLLFPSGSPYRMVSAVIGMRVVAIMPTLLIVQIGLDHILRDSDTSDCERPATSIILDTILITTHESHNIPHTDVHDASRYPS